MATQAPKIAAGGDTPRRTATVINTLSDYINVGLLQSRTVAELALELHEAGRMFFCTNEAGGAVPVFSDGTNWRRVTDRAVAS